MKRNTHIHTYKHTKRKVGISKPPCTGSVWQYQVGIVEFYVHMKLVGRNQTQIQITLNIWEVVCNICSNRNPMKIKTPVPHSSAWIIAIHTSKQHGMKRVRVCVCAISFYRMQFGCNVARLRHMSMIRSQFSNGIKKVYLSQEALSQNLERIKKKKMWNKNRTEQNRTALK